MDETKPLILGRYRYMETLGEGGSGSVELCWDTRIQRRVAIKRLPLTETRTLGRTPGLAEARTGAMLSHPSIVSVYDFETTRDEALLIMEAIEGPPLSQLIDATPAATFDLDVLASIATAVANALDFAHENQVLHLDIKPDNILITCNGTTKVSDFGISELAGAQGFGEASGGTVGYMPPEQMRGETLDQRCDEFAFAMVVYEMLTGRNPYAAKTPSASLRAIERERIVPPSELRDDIDPALDSILLAALSPDRAQRYLTIYDFFDTLLPYLGDARMGVAKLRDAVNYGDESGEDGDGPSRPALWERFGPARRRAVGRILSAILSWALATLGLGAIGTVGLPAACLVALLAALAALVKPALGAFMALVSYGVGLCVGAAVPIWGIAAIAWSIAWFALLGRELLVRPEAAADLNCALCVAPLGFALLAPLAPMLAGRCLPIRRALLASVTSALIACPMGLTAPGALPIYLSPLLEAGLAPDEGALSLFASPTFWVIIFSWILAAICMSAACSRATRVSSALGSVMAAVVLLVGQAVAVGAAIGTWNPPSVAWTLSVAASALITIIGGTLVTPPRDRGED